MAGDCIIRYNERFDTWDVCLYDRDEEIESWEVDSIACDKRYIDRVKTFEPQGDA